MPGRDQGRLRVRIGAVTEVGAAPVEDRGVMTETPFTTPPQRSLRRSRGDRMVAGVCAGVAEYLRVDPTLVRIGFVVLVVISWGVALLAYLAGWLLMPEAP